MDEVRKGEFAGANESIEPAGEALAPLSIKPAFVREAGAGIEPANRGFADLDLTTWLPRRAKSRQYPTLDSGVNVQHNQPLRAFNFFIAAGEYAYEEAADVIGPLSCRHFGNGGSIPKLCYYDYRPNDQSCGG
jgi:hypothetical protein